jgi:hypothetical protein
MLCDRCKKVVLETNEPWGDHHQLKVLKESASAGCFICVQLNEDIEKIGLGLEEVSVTHRWTIRMNTHAREESSRSITVTFRAVVSKPVEPSLPTRVFYLINEKGPHVHWNE